MRGDDLEEYSTKDMARLTDIAESTVRKYALLLEKNGYSFMRNANGNRVFTENDIKIFLELKATPKEEKSIEHIASDIADKYTTKVKKAVTSNEDVSDDMQLNKGVSADMLTILIEKVNDLTDTNQKQTELIEELFMRLDQQQKYIEERLEERDRKLVESLRQSQEEKLALLEMAATQEEKKKGFLARLFGSK